MMDFLSNLSNHIDYTILGAMISVVILSFVPKIDLLVENFSKFFMIISVIALILMTLIVSYDVIARKLWHGGSIAMQELEWHLFDITFLFSIAYTLARDKHVRVDIFYDKFHPKLKAIIQIITIIFFVVPLATLIVVEAIPFVQMSYEMQESSGDPGGLCCRWIIKSTMIWAFLVVLIQSIAELKKAYYKLKYIEE
jgi:TRAP-type mannitol/chloroaromatic compound transport system permease small subunit